MRPSCQSCQSGSRCIAAHNWSASTGAPPFLPRTSCPKGVVKAAGFEFCLSLRRPALSVFFFPRPAASAASALFGSNRTITRPISKIIASTLGSAPFAARFASPRPRDRASSRILRPSAAKSGKNSTRAASPRERTEVGRAEIRFSRTSDLIFTSHHPAPHNQVPSGPPKVGSLRSAALALRPQDSNLAFRCHDKAPHPICDAFLPEQLNHACDQVLSIRRVKTDKEDPMVRARSKPAQVRKIQILGD